MHMHVFLFLPGRNPRKARFFAEYRKLRYSAKNAPLLFIAVGNDLRLYFRGEMRYYGVSGNRLGVGRILRMLCVLPFLGGAFGGAGDSGKMKLVKDGYV
jgi:hypothetical protein